MLNKTALLIVITSALLATACQSSSTPKNPFKQPAKRTACTEPRPDVCTKEYLPVCATRDTGIRCVTTPCASTEEVTSSNACTACSDSKVESYVLGACTK